MSVRDKEEYHKYFIQADMNQDGVINGGEANHFFTKLKLSRQLLAKIWSLVDQQKKGHLTEPMFYAMYHMVMKIKKSGGELKVPHKLPKCLTINEIEKLETKIRNDAPTDTIEAKPTPSQHETVKKNEYLINHKFAMK